MSRTTRSTVSAPTTPVPTTPSAPTPADTEQLAGLVREPRTSRIGQTAVILGEPANGTPSAPVAAATGRARKPQLTGWALAVAGRATVTELQEGMFWAERVGVRTGNPDCIGDVRAFIGADVLPTCEPGTRFETWHADNRLDCGIWEVLASKPIRKVPGTNRLLPGTLVTG